MRWWRRAGVQRRSALAATAVLAGVIALAAIGQVIFLDHFLVARIEGTAADQAMTIAGQVDATALESPRPRAPGIGGGPEGTDLLRAIAAEAGQRSVVQVLDGSGRVIVSSVDVEGLPPLSGLRPTPGVTEFSSVHVPIDEDPYRLAVRGGLVSGQRFTVVVGQSLGPVEDSIQTVLLLLGIGVPMLLLAVWAATYLFVGRALQPVEGIRRSVASITARDLDERVPTPDSDDEIAKLAVTMNAMLDRLQSSQRVQRQFVADAGHELRSPITTLKASAEVYLAHQDVDSTQFASTVLDEAGRLERLVRDLLLLARADEQALQIEVRDVDVDDVADAERRRVSATSRLDVETRLRPARVRADPHLLSQVVRNLVDNAVQHAHSRIQLVTEQRDGHVVIEVFDDGPGIAPEDRRRIFERFVRLDESRDRASGGTGLGLAIVHEIVTAHGGEVCVVDDPCGTRFRVQVPTG
jgi:signal transduction histidine kinase